MPLRSAMRSNRAMRRLSSFSINWPKRRNASCASWGGVAVAMRLMKASSMSAASHGKRPLAAESDREEKEGGRDARGAGVIPARRRAADTKGQAAAVRSVRIKIKLCACHFGAEPHSFTDDMLTRQFLRDLRRG